MDSAAVIGRLAAALNLVEPETRISANELLQHLTQKASCTGFLRKLWDRLGRFRPHDLRRPSQRDVHLHNLQSSGISVFPDSASVPVSPVLERGRFRLNSKP